MEQLTEDVDVDIPMEGIDVHICCCHGDRCNNKQFTAGCRGEQPTTDNRVPTTTRSPTATRGNVLLMNSAVMKYGSELVSLVVVNLVSLLMFMT